MSDEKIQVEIAKGLENEDTYKKIVPGVLKQINSGNKYFQLPFFPSLFIS